MATYTHDGEVYDAEDNEIQMLDSELSDEERHEREILKVHPFLNKRRVRIKTDRATKRKGWASSDSGKFVGKNGVVLGVHGNEVKAVKVKVEDYDYVYLHYDDLELIEPEPFPDPVMFNPLSLVVGE